jgi:prephenate dehydrogenase
MGEEAGELSSAECDTLAIVGVGLIGGSIGLAARQRGIARQVVGIGRRQSALQLACERGAITSMSTDLATGVAQADLIVVCSPVETIPDLVAQVAEHCPHSALITDAGSTKQAIGAALDERLRADQATFNGSHPLAGSEKAGVANAQADLFVDRLVILTPTDRTPAAAQDRLQAFWKGLGAQVRCLTPARHDSVLAATSHLPHVIAAVLAAATPSDFLAFAATGWADTTRVAAGDVDMWQQILRQNRDCVLRCLDDFAKVLNCLTRALERQDDAAVAEILTLGKRQRDALAD